MTVLEDPPTTAAPHGDDNGGGGLVFIGMAGLLIALVATVVVIGLIGLLRDEGDGGGGVGGDGASAGPTMVGVTLSEFSIDGDLVAPPGEVSMLVTNNGSQQHNLVVRETGAETPILNTGENATLSLGTLDIGTYELYCSIVGHAESGMVAPFEVTNTPAPTGEAAAGGSHDHNSPDFDADEMDAIMIN